MRVAIIDYGAGNTFSVCKAFARVGADPVLTISKDEILTASAIVLPGVGAYAAAMNRFMKHDILSVLTHVAIERQIPTLGICLGMQLMGKSSIEKETHAGLGWLDFQVEDLNSICHDVPRLPHVGWNDVDLVGPSKLLANPDRCSFYFDHSYAISVCNSSLMPYVTSTCEYGGEFAASIEHKNLFGVQYHPEISGMNGAVLIEKFLSASFGS